jgi:hypothetical protein
MIHSVTEIRLDEKIATIFTRESERIGAYANKLCTTYNAAQSLPNFEQRFQLKLFICLVMLSTQHDADLNLNDQFFSTGSRPRLFYDCISQNTDLVLNTEITVDEYIQRCVRTQRRFVHWTQANADQETVGIILATSSRDEHSPYFGLHELMKLVYIKMYNR